MKVKERIPHDEIVKIKLADLQMRENLDKAMHTLQRNRALVIKNKFSNWEGLRSQARLAKDKSLQSLHDRLLEFERNAQKNGMRVHWAETREDACEIIHQIMLDKDARLLLKGKSMASEEIGLNEYLRQKGIKAVETDLGELIIQLNSEDPVHIVAPAVHKNRFQVGEIFRDKLDVPLKTEIEELNGIARLHLRDQFEGLKVGLSGVNFAISKEGAVWLIENEGNGRMCSTAPDVHIALCGIEKILETFEDAATMVHLLTPSACGQFIPTYNNIITGPRKKDEKDGPREVHVILFNNHRTEMLASENYQTALRCIRCGTCINFCPVYMQIGGHAYQTVYPGPIGEAISPNLFGMDKTGDILSFCSMCGRCSEVCPVKIPLHDIIRQLRSSAAGQDASVMDADKADRSSTEALAFKVFVKIATSGRMWRLNLSAVHTFNWVLHTFGHRLPVIRLWSKYKDMPDMKESLHDNIKGLPGVKYE